MLLPIEIASSKLVSIVEYSLWTKKNKFSFFVLDMLFHLTESITNSIKVQQNSNSNPQFLPVITKPLTTKIVQVNCLFDKLENNNEKLFSH